MKNLHLLRKIAFFKSSPGLQTMDSKEKKLSVTAKAALAGAVTPEAEIERSGIAPGAAALR